jgi:hypothetical protein
MSNLKVGAPPLEIPGLSGHWSVWCSAADAPGAVFVVPADDQARATGIKYAVVKAIQKSTEATPTLTLIRTDPALPTIEGATP